MVQIQKKYDFTRPLAKLASDSQVREAYGTEDRSVLNIHEDLDTGATKQLAAEGEFCKRFTQDQAVRTLSTVLIPDAWKGASWKILSCACFASINGIVRYLSGGVPALQVDPLPYYEIAFLQNIVGSLVLLPWIIRNGLDSLKTTRPGLHLSRILFAALGLMLWYGALHHMPLAQAVALAFTGPIFTVLGCRVFLKEKLTLPRIAAIAFSFLGAFIITRPDQALFSGDGLMATIGIYALFPLLAAISWVGSTLVGRVLASRGEPASLMTIYLLLFMAPISLIPTLSVWVVPTFQQCLWVIIIGIIAGLAHLSLARSYALADISFLMPFGFTRLLLSGVIGYVAFGEIPKTIGVWIGMGIILTSVILLSYRSKLSIR